MGFTEWLAWDLVLTAIVLLWARWSNLDLGLRAPIFSGAWPWIVLYVAWYAAERTIFGVYPPDEDPDWATWLQ